MYDILYADPPWDYNGKECHTKTSAVASAKDHYPCMTLDELKKLPIQSVSKENSLCFLWTSSPHLAQAIELLQAWGFEYKTIAFIWEKQALNPGFYTLSQCEICLVGKRGTIPKPRGTRNERQFLSEKRGRHSAKPVEIRKRIERMFPQQRKLELFARERAEGWDVFGNQVADSIALHTQ